MTKTFRCHDAEACALGQKQCPMPTACGLHQIQEPSAAEQAAWHAGLDEGRAQAAPAAVAVSDEREALTDEERAFVETVKQRPGEKLNNGEALGNDGAALWEKPEQLGLIKCVGSYKWVESGKDFKNPVIAAVEAHNALAATPAAAAPGKLGDHMQIRCRKCGDHAMVEFNSARIVTHNPHTGKPRDARDIAIDPEGKLIAAPGPLFAADAQVVLPEPATFEAWAKSEGGPFALHNCGPYNRDAMKLAGMAWHASALLAAVSTPAAQSEPVAWPHVEIGLVALEWKRQKRLFPVLSKDGWMDQAINKLRLAHTSATPQAKADAQAVERGEVLVTVSGFTGSGKSAIAGEIEIMCRALGLQVEWPDGDSEKNMTHADWTAALELYKPRVRIVENNIPRASKEGPTA